MKGIKKNFNVLPHSTEAEQSILGGLMLDNDKFNTIDHIIEINDFHRQDHKIIYEAIYNLFIKNKPFDIITVSEFLLSKNKLKKIGGFEYLTQLIKNTPGTTNMKAYANIINEYSILRKLIKAGSNIIESALNANGKKILEIIDYSEKQIFDISKNKNKKSKIKMISDIFKKTIHQIKTLSESSNTISGLSSGFFKFDKLTSGLQKADLIIIAGRPSMGKTTFAMNIAEHNIITTNKPILIFSMEMPSEQIGMRLLSSITKIELQKIRTGSLNDNEWKQIMLKIPLINNKKLFIDDSESLSPIDIRTKARKITKEHGQLGIIIIDYLQLMKIQGINENRTYEISEISRSLKSLAKELNVPLIALSQLNRSLEQRIDRRPIMSDLRESGAIEQDADLIIFIYRDELYHKDSKHKGIAEIIIGKQRNGPLGSENLFFRGEYSKFENII
ncbi:MAG: replicative DNA helicase [Candidatus Azosocius agrarius]|nr:MAG: replicative DNA helicase [Gammaproteobacteria bacterium]